MHEPVASWGVAGPWSLVGGPLFRAAVALQSPDDLGGVPTGWPLVAAGTSFRAFEDTDVLAEAYAWPRLLVVAVRSGASSRSAA